MKSPAEHKGHDDAIFEVTGVTSSEILHRCAALRGGLKTNEFAASRASSTVSSEVRATWRLVDFADLSEFDFVDAVHLVLLGRRPSDAERTGRIAQLRDGSSRFQVVVRLVLSPEGRRMRDRPFSGVALPILAAIGSCVDRAATTRLLGSAVQRADQAVRRHLHEGAEPR